MTRGPEVGVRDAACMEDAIERHSYTIASCLLLAAKVRSCHTSQTHTICEQLLHLKARDKTVLRDIDACTIRSLNRPAVQFTPVDGSRL